MKRTKMIAVIIVVTSIFVLIAAGLISGIGIGLDQVRRTFGALDPQTAILLGTACLTALLGAWLIAAAIRRAKKREVAAIEANNRRHLYGAVLESLIASPAETGPANPALRAGLALLASVPVLQEYRATLRVLCAPGSTEDDVRQQIGRLTLTMRRDLGISSFGLEGQDSLDWLSGFNPSAAARKAVHPSAQPAAPDRLPPAHRLFPET